jgi:hypothetical protein
MSIPLLDHSFRMPLSKTPRVLETPTRERDRAPRAARRRLSHALRLPPLHMLISVSGGEPHFWSRVLEWASARPLLLCRKQGTGMRDRPKTTKTIGREATANLSGAKVGWQSAAPAVWPRAVDFFLLFASPSGDCQYEDPCLEAAPLGGRMRSSGDRNGGSGDHGVRGLT